VTISKSKLRRYQQFARNAKQKGTLIMNVLSTTSLMKNLQIDLRTDGEEMTPASSPNAEAAVISAPTTNPQHPHGAKTMETQDIPKPLISGAPMLVAATLPPKEIPSATTVVPPTTLPLGAPTTTNPPIPNPAPGAAGPTPPPRNLSKSKNLPVLTLATGVVEFGQVLAKPEKKSTLKR
jgi:hypothetical protein